ncbi:MAG TPA: hypothetical protein VNT55_03410 [Baekduia sp.]|nr:hypothetical protein [Baekduia sp.]
MSTQFETDYLVVGAGATALAFVDTILDETDADVILVDRYDKPGGHWRVAYDHVRLHQPSEYYGVNSRPLGTGSIETDGYNAGLLELAGADEIRNYFEKVVTEKFLPSGRVRYWPNSEYLGDGKVARIHSGERLDVQPRRRTVDTTFMNITVPSVAPPGYTVDPDVSLVAPNGLARLSHTYDRYVVIGGGKTAIDTVLWLLDRETPAHRISWVVPRDAWLFNREICQPGAAFREISDAYGLALAGAWLESSSLDELFDTLVDAKYLLCLSDDVRPTAFRCATVTVAELDALRKVDDVVRLGRVLEVNPRGLVLEGGTRELDGDVLYVDCTADGLARVAPVPVFQPGLVTLQPVFFCQQVYSAAFIAHVEARADDDQTKNALTAVVPHPYDPVDYLRSGLVNFRNEVLWSQDPEIVQWRQDARLAGIATRVGTPLPPAGPERDETLVMIRDHLAALIAKAEKLLGGIDAPRETVGAET